MRLSQDRILTLHGGAHTRPSRLPDKAPPPPGTLPSDPAKAVQDVVQVRNLRCAQHRLLRQLALGTAAVIGFAPWRSLRAQTDEIQVYDAHIAAPAVFNLTLHDNFTPDGRTAPDFPGGVVPNHALNGVPEWAYGVTPWMEAGLYLPLYSYAADGSVTINGFKLRTLFVKPDAAHAPFFYGVNFEFSYNTAHWDQNRYTQEIRPIIGWHLGPIDLIVNPILDNSYKGFLQLDFAPASRFAYNLNAHWAMAAEEYDDIGPLRKFLPAHAQVHQLFGVIDYSGHPWSIEGGVGIGLTGAGDKLVLKMILSRDLNQQQ